MNKLKNEKGFTLVEMLIVLMIISVLLLIIVPNLSKNNEVASTKGCEATVKLLQAQVHAYKLEKTQFPENLDVLKDSGYVDKTTCSNEMKIDYDRPTGKVSTAQSSSKAPSSSTP